MPKSLKVLLLVLLVALAGLSALLGSPRALLWSATTLVNFATPYTLLLENPRADTFGNTFEIATLQLLPDGSDGPPLVAIEQLQVAYGIEALLAGGLATTDIQARSVLAYVDSTDTQEDPDARAWLRSLIWLPRALSIDIMHVIARGENVWIFPLRKLRGQRTANGLFSLTAEADHDREPVTLALTLEEPVAGDAAQSLLLTADVRAAQSGGHIALDGRLVASGKQLNYQFDMNLDYPRIENFLSILQRDAYDFAGQLILRGKLAGNLQAYTLDIRDMSLDNPPDYRFSARGQLRGERSSPAELDVQASGELASMALLLKWFNTDLSALGTARADVTLSGSLADPLVDTLTLNTESRDGLRIALSSDGEPLRLADMALVGEQAVRVRASAPNVGVLKDWLGDLPLDPGPWQASATLRKGQQVGHFALTDISALVGQAGATEIKISGKINDAFVTGDQGPALTGIDLAFDGTVLGVNELLTPQALAAKIPALAELSAAGRLTGGTENLAFSVHSLAATGDGLHLTTQPFSGKLISQNKFLPQATGVSFTASIDSLQALAFLIEAPLPESGPITVRGTLNRRGSTYALDKLSADLSLLGGSLAVDGAVGSLGELADVAIGLTAKTIDARQLFTLLNQPLPADTNLGSLSGTSHVSRDKQGNWQAREINLQLAGSGELTGDVTGAATLQQGAINAQVEASYTAGGGFMASLGGPAMPGGHGTFVLDYQPARVVLAVHSIIGESDIVALMDSYRDATGVRSLALDINAPHVRLTDLAGIPGAGGVQEEAPAEVAQTETLQSAVLPWLPAYPITVNMNVGGISGDNTAIGSFALALSSNERVVILEAFDIAYADGEIQLRGVADLKSTPPNYSLAGLALAVPVTALAADLGYAGEIEGTLTARGGLSASGANMAAAKASLDGSLSVAVADGLTEGSALDLLMTDLLRWLLRGGLSQSSTLFDCGMAQFSFADGIATSDSLYLETRNMIATGQGTIDLPRAQLDIRIDPRARDRGVQIPSSVRIRGSLEDPKIIASPVAATFDATAKLLFMVPELALKLFGIAPNSEAGVQPCAVPTAP